MEIPALVLNSQGKQTISVESMDTLGFHLSIVGLALLIGTLFKRALTAMQGLSPFLEDTKFFSGFPLFPFTMFGGIMIQVVHSCRALSCPCIPNHVLTPVLSPF